MDFPCHCNFYDLAGLSLPISVTFNGESGGDPEPFEGCLPLCEGCGLCWDRPPGWEILGPSVQIETAIR